MNGDRAENTPVPPVRRRVLTRSPRSAATLRQRQLYDLIQLVAVYQRDGLLCDLEISHENYEDHAAAELAVLVGLHPSTLHGAKKVLRLSRIRYNENTWQFLKQSSMLGIFADYNFIKGYTAVDKNGGVLCLSFLEAFMNGCDPIAHEQKLQRRRKLDNIALTYTARARDIAVTLFFKAVAVVSTLFSFVPEDVKLDKLKVIDIVDRYLSDGWKSHARQKQYHLRASRIHATDGWHLVSEVFKVQVQELKFWKERTKANSAPADHQHMVGEQDIACNAHRWCHRIVSEFFAWMYHFVVDEESVESFVECIGEVMDKMNEKLAGEMGCDKKEYIPDDLINSALYLIRRKAPTMAEVRYDSAKMTPNKRDSRTRRKLDWIPKEVIMRCRWEGSPVLQIYNSFIQAAVFSEQQRAGANKFTGVSSVPETPINEMELPSSPNPSLKCQNECNGVVEQVGDYGGNVAARHGARGLKRTRPMENGEMADTIPHTEKRLHRVLHTEYGSPPLPSLRRESPFANSRTNAPNTKRSLDSQPRNEIPYYLQDGEDSGDEKADLQHATNSGTQQNSTDAKSTLAQKTNLSIEKFYEAILRWPICSLPVRQKLFGSGKPKPLRLEEKLDTHLLTSMETWLQRYMARQSRFILNDATSAASLEEYCSHWKSVLPIEVRAMVSDKLSVMLPKVKATPSLSWTEDIPKDSFIICRVAKVAPTRKMFNLVCKSVNPELNVKIAHDLKGGSLCVGYIANSQGGFSDLILIACRRLSWEDEDVVPLGLTKSIDELQLHLAVNRERVRDLGIWEDDTVYIHQLCHFAPSLRTYKAVEDVSQLPNFILDTLYGNSPSHMPTDPGVIDELIDPGSAEYLNTVRESTGMPDESQYHSLRSVLANIGKCEFNSISFSLVHGPPGTGKTTLILLLISALMHHSKVGHIGRDQVHALKSFIPLQDIQRCSTNPEGIRILVCCASNQGVDNILEKMHQRGIPDGRGGVIRPQTVRLARAGYDLGKLSMYSIDEKALPFDEHIHHVGQRDRKFASNAARNSFYRECLVVFTTLVSSGGARFKKCKIPFDVVIIDEMGQSTEPESLIPLTNSMKFSSKCHVVGVGDPKQLPPVSIASHAVKHAKKKLCFDYDNQMVSLFERLQKRRRAPSNMLTKQYRMCIAIAEMNNEIFYDGVLESPLPESMFNAPYNTGWNQDSGGFARLTFIDTSLLPSRTESSLDKEGSYMNLEEINIIDAVLQRIKELAGESFTALRNEIAVLVPYRAQVDQLRQALEGYGKYAEKAVSRQGFQILVDTVDSMQGSERDIVIFGSTRSNSEQKIGFLDKENRLNVATSRGRKLQVLIGDLSTLGANQYFSKMRAFCVKGRQGSVLLQLHETTTSSILDGLKPYRE